MKENITAGKINLKLSLRVWLQTQKKKGEMIETNRKSPS